MTPSASSRSGSPADVVQEAEGAELLAIVARLHRWATRHTNLSISTALVRLLAQIDDLGPSRIGDLARADHTSQPTMTTQVQRLEAEGWVTREPDPADARAVLVAITPAGRNALSQARARRAEVVAPHVAALSTHEHDTLADAVEILRRLLADAGATHTSVA